VHRALSVASEPDNNDELLRTLIDEQQRTNRLLSFIVYFAGAFVIGAVGLRAYMHWRGVM
jgi:ubiquinone biosynthesis protein